MQPVISHAAYCLVHTPNLVRYGSKPRREILKDAAFEERLSVLLRDFGAAASYPPNQTFVGNLTPRELARIDRPWYAQGTGVADESITTGRFGTILPQAALYGLLKQADVLEPALVDLSADAAPQISAAAAADPAASTLITRQPEAVDSHRLRAELQAHSALPLMLGDRLAGLVRRDNRAEGREDPNLEAAILLEALCTKATAALALQSLIRKLDVGPEGIDYIISCGEEAIGDRYQRGGGGIAKSVGQMCACINASGMDVKNFCAAPASALIAAGALVAAGVYERVAVVAGGSLAKLGMKSEAFIREGLPILDDCLASHAFLVCRDDGRGPVMHLEPGSVGIATIGSSTAEEAVYRQLLLEPLDALGLKMTDIDRYAPELHNPEIMQHAGSGDVAHKNHRMIAAMAVRAGLIRKSEMPEFIDRAGMIGFAPTQGHIPSGVAYIGHALDAIRAGEARRVMVLSKASLFLNRLTELYDGVSFVLEANPASIRGLVKG